MHDDTLVAGDVEEHESREVVPGVGERRLLSDASSGVIQTVR